mmetsp:Transcript_34563/g.84507  ORF Transcript_34563/g.84507 Transcript_34563/m.84507 type:complete len:299 (-) Transcript_34563:164-1060(-)
MLQQELEPLLQLCTPKMHLMILGSLQIIVLQIINDALHRHCFAPWPGNLRCGNGLLCPGIVKHNQGGHTEGISLRRSCSSWCHHNLRNFRLLLLTIVSCEDHFLPRRKLRGRRVLLREPARRSRLLALGVRANIRVGPLGLLFKNVHGQRQIPRGCGQGLIQHQQRCHFRVDLDHKVVRRALVGGRRQARGVQWAFLLVLCRQRSTSLRRLIPFRPNNNRNQIDGLAGCIILHVTANPRDPHRRVVERQALPVWLPLSGRASVCSIGQQGTVSTSVRLDSSDCHGALRRGQGTHSAHA